jgi:hypothetical protein
MSIDDDARKKHKDTTIFHKLLPRLQQIFKETSRSCITALREKNVIKPKEKKSSKSYPNKNSSILYSLLLFQKTRN